MATPSTQDGNILICSEGNFILVWWLDGCKTVYPTRLDYLESFLTLSTLYEYFLILFNIISIGGEYDSYFLNLNYFEVKV